MARRDSRAKDGQRNLSDNEAHNEVSARAVELVFIALFGAQETANRVIAAQNVFQCELVEGLSVVTARTRSMSGGRTGLGLSGRNAIATSSRAGWPATVHR